MVSEKIEKQTLVNNLPGVVYQLHYQAEQFDAELTAQVVALN